MPWFTLKFGLFNAKNLYIWSTVEQRGKRVIVYSTSAMSTQSCTNFIQLSLELWLQVFDARLKKVIKVIVFIKKIKINQNRALLCLLSTSVTNRRTATSTKIMCNLNRYLNKSCLLITLLYFNWLKKLLKHTVNNRVSADCKTHYLVNNHQGLLDYKTIFHIVQVTNITWVGTQRFVLVRKLDDTSYYVG